ncbi:MAG: YncE family protein [bacterium]
MGFSVRKTSAALAAILLLGALTGARGQYLEATIPVGHSPQSLIWSPLGNKVYVANTQDGTVSVIDGATNVVIATIPVEDYPDMFALNTVNGKVYCPSGSEDRLNVICAHGDTLIRKVRLSGYPLWPVYNERRNKLYLSATDNDRVYSLDGAADTMLGWTAGRSPLWSVLQSTEDRLLVPIKWNSDTMLVLDCRDDTVVARHPLEQGVEGPACIGFAGKAYVPCESVIEVFSADCEEHLTSIGVTLGRPRSSAYYPAAAKLYIGNINRGQIAVIDSRTDSVIGEIGVGERAYSMVCDTVRGRLYSLSDMKLLVFSTRNDSLVATVSYPGYSGEDLAWNPVNSKLYTANLTGDAVYVVRDTVTAVEEPTPAGPVGPGQVASVVRRAGLSSGSLKGLLYGPDGRLVLMLPIGTSARDQLAAGVYFLRQEDTGRTLRLNVVP